MTRPLREAIRSYGATPDVRHGASGALVLEHFYRGARIQRVLRLTLVAFFVATLLSAPPADERVLSWCIVLSYALWAVTISLLVRLASAEVVPYVWLALVLDLVATSGLTLVADSSAEQTWTAYILVNGFFLLPILAAAQLSPWVCLVISALAVIAYAGSGAAIRHDVDEPWAALVLRVLLLAIVALGCVLLSRLQRRRVRAIGRLAVDRQRLVDELVDVEQRERRDLAEHLHDGALQYVLAARHELDDVATDEVARERTEEALTRAAELLRSTLTQLHPAVVDGSGLLPALRDLTEGVGRQAGLRIDLVTREWDETARTTVDALLLGAARELLANVVKHAQARSATVEVSLSRTGDRQFARLVVIDDGVGLGTVQLNERLGAGHLGLASRRIHVEAAGGTLSLADSEPRGTRAEIRVPAELR